MSYMLFHHIIFQLAILSTSIFINLPFHQLTISSTYHFINLSIHQLTITLACPFINPLKLFPNRVLGKGK